MKFQIIIGLFILSIAFSCKDKATTENEAAPTETKQKLSKLQLANYSDENWKNGVGITYNMILLDFSQEKLDLLKSGKQLVLADGKVIDYINVEVVDKFIQISLNDKPTTFQAAIEYPNELTVK